MAVIDDFDPAADSLEIHYTPRQDENGNDIVPTLSYQIMSDDNVTLVYLDGQAIAGLGGVRDRSSLALTAGRMREDPVFRDAAHHFLRTFDRCFAEFESLASDAELADLADTRTARAFMLFGRVTGTFD